MKRTNIVILILALYLPSFADYHYASHTGSNTYPYNSWESAADSVQKAINVAISGDTIYVGSGIWSDMPCTLWTDLSLIGGGIDSTIIRRITNPPGYRFIWIIGSGNLVEGFTFDGIDLSYPVIAIEAYLHTANLTIKNNNFINLHNGLQYGENSGVIVNNQFLNCQNGIDAIFDACSLLVKNNSFIENNAWCIAGYRGIWKIVNNIFAFCPDAEYCAGIVLRGDDSGYVANNLFYKNHENEHLTQIFDFITNLSPSMKCENNTFVGPDNPWYQIAIGNSGNTSMPLYSINNAISGFPYAYFTYPGDSINVTYNDIWRTPNLAGGYGNTALGEGNIFFDPMFANQDSEDVRLQTNSPLIDAGDLSILDVDGTRSDIGCYGGPGGSAYPYIDLPPHVPDSLTYYLERDSIILSWRMNTEADFYRYIINRDTVPNFAPWAGNILSEPDTSLYIDTHWDRFHNYYYKIAAYDNQWNLSPYSTELEVYITSVTDPFNPNLPQMTEISNNYPNPFNSQTTISYYLADIGYQPAEVKLYIYNISGQLIRKLVDTRQYPGSYRAVWDGLGEGGETLSSGIYFARLIVSGIELQRAKKITLLK
jgi:hypothetical protein